MNFNRVQEVFDAAAKAGVSFSLHYSEASGLWYYSVGSIAPSEEWIGRDRDFDMATDDVLEWLRSLVKS